MDLKDRIKALRKELGLTQEALAERGGLERVEVSNLESGRNQATSVRILRGLAKAFALSLQDAAEFVDGTLSVEEAAQRSRAGGSGPRPPREIAADLAREIGVSELAISDVLRDPITPERENWRALWWADEMRRREIAFLPSAAPSGTAPATFKSLAAKLHAASTAQGRRRGG